MRALGGLVSLAVLSVASHAFAGDLEPQWTALCTGLREGGGNSPGAFAMTTFDDGSGEALYVAGRFRFAGSLTVNNIARWDGSAWSALADGLGSQTTSVEALAVFDDGDGPALYAAGSFTTIGGVTFNRIAKWNGATWLPLEGPGGVGITGGSSTEVRALAVYNDGGGDALYVAGRFTAAGGVGATNIAKWDGTTWSAIGGASGGNGVESLAVFDDGSGESLFVGGSFTTAGGLSIARIARYNAGAWSGVGGGLGAGGATVYAMQGVVDGPSRSLYVGGTITSAGGGVFNLNYIARWDGAQWSRLTTNGVNGVNWWVRSMTLHDDGSGPALFAGGRFETAGGIPVGGVAKWTGDAWEPLGVGVSGGVVPEVLSLASFNDGKGASLFAGGFFTAAGGQGANRIARWGGPRTNPSCPADLNFDCAVNFSDLNAVLSAFGNLGAPGSVVGDVNGDVNGDGVVNFADLNQALSGFGLPCE